jgi:sigma-B regulation protein RsbU (phosphoserine phosphatase)
MATVPTSQQDSLPFDLQPLLEFSRIVNSSVDMRFILNTLLFTVMGKMLITRGMILLHKNQAEHVVVAVRGVNEFVEGEIVIAKKVPSSPVLLRNRRFAALGWVKRMRTGGLELLVPILVRSKVRGMVVLGPRVSGHPFSHTDKNLIASLVGLTSTAIEKAMSIEELKEANRSLDRKIQELNTLFEVSKEFNIGLDAQRVIRLLTFSLMGQVGVKRYAICYETDGRPVVVASKGDMLFDAAMSIPFLNHLQAGVRLSELTKKKRTKGIAENLLRAGFQVAVPMIVQQNMKGMILLGDKLRGEAYTDGDLEFLSALANVASVSIENARLFREAIEKQRLDDELAIAREIQQGLLPRSMPDIPGFELAATAIPSTEVGGDYYDVIPRSLHEYVLAIGDVSGKGTPAALLMANVQAALRTMVSMNLTPAETTARVNNLTADNTGNGNFITLFWGVLDINAKKFAYVNAGHNPPLLIRSDGSLERLDAGGIILGMMKTTTPYQEGCVSFHPGDVLFLFTDGVSEAMNEYGEEFTEEQLVQVVLAHHAKSTQEIITAVRSALAQHTRGTPQSDDITMLVLRAL